jgi:micrococcal nuclease
MAAKAVTIPSFKSNDMRLWHYRASVIRVVDGDTLDMFVDKGFGDYTRQRVRLLGVDTPEMRPRKGSPDERIAEKAAAKRATDRVIALVENREVILKTAKAGKFGRWLGVIYLPEDVVTQLGRIADDRERLSLNDLLLEEGHAVPYPK